MKNNFLKLTLAVVVAFLFVACEKDEKQVIFEGGTNPNLKTSATAPLVLLKDRLNDIAISFSWTNGNNAETHSRN